MSTNDEIMDQHTRELLELEKVRDLLSSYNATSLGKALTQELEPSTDAVSVREQIALVTEMTDSLSDGHAPPFEGVHDVKLPLQRAAAGSMLTIEQLLEIADTLTATGNLYRYRMRLDSERGKLIALLSPIEDLAPMARSITGCIDRRGNVLDIASPELAAVRQKLAEVDERVQNQIRRLLRDPKIREILRYPNATVSGDHYVLPVAVNHRQKIQGVVHRTSNTGETVFIEPSSVASLSAERAVLNNEEEREIRKVLRRLSAEVGRVSKPLIYTLKLVAKLDLITAKARFSLDYKMFPPDINEEGRVWIRQARHPLLESLFRNEQTEEKREVVPIDVRLGMGFRLLIITGPNTGGKTVCLKTTGLLCMMAQCGMHIPASSGSTVPIFQNIFADIGDEQSLEQSLSTFSSHISRISWIIENANEHSLILLDEMGAGTDPTEGAALGRAILDTLDEIGCLSMVTTHLGDLKTYSFNNDQAENGAVQFDIESLRPTYVLDIGKFGMSNALKIAKRLKVRRDVIDRAYGYLKKNRNRNPELGRLQALREDAEKAREEARLAQHEAEKRQVELEHEKAKVEKEAEEARQLRELRAKLKSRDKVHVTRFDKPGEIVRVDHKRNIAVVSVGLGQWEVPLEEILPPKESN